MTIKSFLIKSTALAGLATVIAISGIGATPAEAGHKKHHKKFGVHVVLGGGPLLYSGYGYHGYHGYKSCHWLKKKAWQTGSKYWWKKYYQCKHD